MLTSISVDSSHISLSSDLNGTEIKLPVYIDRNGERENELISAMLLLQDMFFMVLFVACCFLPSLTACNICLS